MVFPTIVGFPRYILCLNIISVFCIYFVHTSTVRLWPNELVNLFLTEYQGQLEQYYRDHGVRLDRSVPK